MKRLLRPVSGQLVTLMFPIGDHAGGPPYAVSVDLYRQLLEPLGFEAIEIRETDKSFPARMGREKVGRWNLKG
jgi:methyl halide transferase